MADQKNGNAKENDNVIQGPWPKPKRKVKILDEKVLELRKNMEFAEELNQEIIIKMIQTMGENDIGVTDKSFIRYLGLIIELTNGSIYRSMGIPHPTHAFFEALVDLTIDDDKTIHTQIDLNKFKKFIKVSEYFGEDDSGVIEISEYFGDGDDFIIVPSDDEDDDDPEIS